MHRTSAMIARDGRRAQTSEARRSGLRSRGVRGVAFPALMVALCASSASALVRGPVTRRSPVMMSATSLPKRTVESVLDSVMQIPNYGRRMTPVQKEGTGISLAIRRLERDLNSLDERVAREPQLASTELAVLAIAVGASAASPIFFSTKIVELIAPAMAALAATIGVSAEYSGRMTSAEGKEVAAVTLQAAAEAEAVLSRSERVKAIMPLCVGISAGGAAFSLLAPALIEEFSAVRLLAPFVSGLGAEVFLLFWPFAAVMAAAIASLAARECCELANRAIGVGERRLSSKNTVSRTWLSATEQIAISTGNTRSKWWGFAKAILPAPTLGVLLPGALAAKAVVMAAVAAAQAAYYLTVAEYQIARAISKVAEKTRCAALAEVYANQGAQAAAILPFTSALSAGCVAAAAAVVELQPTLGIIFPALGSIFAAAASVSKAQCEVDTAAAAAAATDLSRTGKGGDEDLPLRTTIDNIRLSLRASWIKVKTQFKARRRLAVDLVLRLFGKVDKPSQKVPATAPAAKAAPVVKKHAEEVAPIDDLNMPVKA